MIESAVSRPDRARWSRATSSRTRLPTVSPAPTVKGGDIGLGRHGQRIDRGGPGRNRGRGQCGGHNGRNRQRIDIRICRAQRAPDRQFVGDGCRIDRKFPPDGQRTTNRDVRGFDPPGIDNVVAVHVERRFEPVELGPAGHGDPVQIGRHMDLVGHLPDRPELALEIIARLRDDVNVRS